MTGATLQTGQFTVGATAALAVGAKTVGKKVRVRNTHATNLLYVGVAGVTATTGYLIPPGQSEPVDVTADVYVVGSAAGTTGCWLEVS